MERRGLPRKHYPEVKKEIHREKELGPRGPDKGQDLDDDIIGELIEVVKKLLGI
jgi:hypothetical protein